MSGVGLLKRLGMTLPVVQAPIGSASTPALVAAVSNAGGLGMLALTWTSPDAIRAAVREVQALTPHTFGVNLVLEWPQHERLAICLAEGISVISTFWGDPAPYVDTVHRAGALHVHTVGSAAEAQRAVQAGVDVIVAQGWEAGGHVWGQVSTVVLVPAVVDAIQPVPVLAAGGIGDGRGLAAVLTLGAAAGWVGTAYLVAHESRAHPRYQQAVLAARETDTAHGTMFNDGWPDAPHRALRGSTIDAWEAAGRPNPGSRPGEQDVVATDLTGRRLLRYGDDLPVAGTTGEIEAMAMYAGQSAGLVRRSRPAAEITRGLAYDARRALSLSTSSEWHRNLQNADVAGNGR